MRWFTAALALVVALTVGVGCVSAHDRVVNGDRQLAWQNKLAARAIAGRLQAIAMALAPIPMPAETKAAVDEDLVVAGRAAADVEANASQQIANWGGEQRIQDKKEYSPPASAAARQASAQEHADLAKRAAIWAGVGAVVAWGLKTIGASKIPFLGPVLALLNRGQIQEHQLVQTMQAAVDEARRKYDDLAASIRQRLDGTALEKVGGLIPTGDVLKERLEAELARKGLLTLNSQLYEKNPLIPDDPKEILVRADPAPPPATPAAAPAT